MPICRPCTYIQVCSSQTCFIYLFTQLTNHKQANGAVKERFMVHNWVRGAGEFRLGPPPYSNWGTEWLLQSHSLFTCVNCSRAIWDWLFTGGGSPPSNCKYLCRPMAPFALAKICASTLYAAGHRIQCKSYFWFEHRREVFGFAIVYLLGIVSLTCLQSLLNTLPGLIHWASGRVQCSHKFVR